MSPLRQSMVNAMTVRGLSERTIECYTESISRFSRHYQGTNPARLTPQQIEACPHAGHRMLLQTLYASGLRVSEACQLQVGDIDSNPDRIGLLANPNGGQLAQAKAALHMPAPNPQAQECAQDFMARVARVNIQQCPVCQRGRMGVVQTLAGAKRLPDPFERGSRKANSRAPPAQGP